MKNIREKAIYLKLMAILVVVYCTMQASVAPLHTASPHSRSGTWIAFTSLKTQTDNIPSYNVLFTTPLAGNSKLNAITSVSSFDLLSSTQFSFNTSLTSISFIGFTVKLQITGNTYANLMKFNYLGMSWATGPSSELLYYDCFLTSDLSYVSTTKSQTFNKQQLVNTVVDGTKLDVQSFITGMTFLNNKDSSKKMSVKSYISNNTNYITQQVYITGNTILQFMCLGTVVIDNNINPWKERQMTSRMGSFKMDRLSFSINMTTFPTGYLPIYNQADRMFFGLVEIELALGKPYQIIQFKSQNNLAVEMGFMSLASGGRMGYLFYAYRACTDPTKLLYSFLDQLCWDACPGGQVKDTTSNICLACHYTCQTCTGPLETQCSACDGGTNFRTHNSGAKTCPCQNGYVDNGVPICSPCSLFISNCNICSSKTVCTACISAQFVYDPTTEKCQCAPSSYHIPANNLCAPYPGCLDAQVMTNIVMCNFCDTAGHFQLNTNNFQCQCVQNYVQSGDKCVDKCGDGINPQGNSTTYCDDGNLLGSDGCSPTCAVETNFGCFVPPGQTRSYCSPARSYSLKYLWTQRVPHQNAGVFIYEVSPANSQLSASDFTYYVESTIPHTIFTGSYDPATSLLKIRVQYLKSIQEQTHTIKITFDPYKMSVPTQSFTIKTSGANFDLTYDSNAKMNIILWYMSSVVSGLIVIASIIMVAINYKIGTVQLLLSSQIVYLGVLSATHDNLSLYPLTGIKYMFGYNSLKQFQINKLNYQTSAILSSGTFAEYLLNFNITPAILILIILVILPLKINVWYKTYQRQKFTSPQMQQKLLYQEPTTSLKQLSTDIKNAQLIADTYVDRVYFSISLIAYFPLVVYFAFQLAFIGRIGKYELSSFANIILSILLLLVDFCFFILIFQDSDKKAKMFNFGSKKLKNYPNRLMMAYFFLVCVFTVVLLTDFTLFILIGINLLVGIYIWVENPFQKFTIQHIDSLSKPIISLICLVGIKVMGFFSQLVIIFPIIIIALLFISMVVTIVRAVLIKIRRGQNAKRILQQAELDDQLDLQEKNMKNSTDASQFDSQKNKKLTGKFTNDPKKDKKIIKDNLPSIQENDLKDDKENNNDDSAGELNKDNQQVIDPDEIGDQNQDELTRIKRSLRQDLKKRRGVVNKANQQTGMDTKKKLKSSKKSRKITTFDEDQALKQHDV